jgi:hypothetical protein
MQTLMKIYILKDLIDDASKNGKTTKVFEEEMRNLLNVNINNIPLEIIITFYDNEIKKKKKY